MIVIADDEGRITQTINSPYPKGYVEFLTNNGTDFVEAPDDIDLMDIYTKYHIDNGAFTARPAFETPKDFAINVGDTVVVECPEGTVLTLSDNSSFTIDDGQIEIEGEMKGEFLYQLRKWPYQDVSIKVTVR